MGKLILAKMWLFVQHPRLAHDSSQASQDLRDQVFMTSIEVIEFGVLLGRSKNTAKWSWIFKTYLQWHAVAYVLSELCTRGAGLEYERAWNAVDSIYDRRMTERTRSHRGVLWRPLKQLYTRAKKRRQELTSKSPESMNSNASVQSSESPAQSLINGFMQNNTNVFGMNPHINGTSSAAEAFELDFNDPAFEDMPSGFGNELGVTNFNDPIQQQNPVTFQPTGGLPFGFQPGMGDFLDGYGGFSGQQSFRQQVPQEWH